MDWFQGTRQGSSSPGLGLFRLPQHFQHTRHAGMHAHSSPKTALTFSIFTAGCLLVGLQVWFLALGPLLTALLSYYQPPCSCSAQLRSFHPSGLSRETLFTCFRGPVERDHVEVVESGQTPNSLSFCGAHHGFHHQSTDHYKLSCHGKTLWQASTTLLPSKRMQQLFNFLLLLSVLFLMRVSAVFSVVSETLTPSPKRMSTKTTAW